MPGRSTVAAAVAAGISVPAMSASLSYFDSYRTARLPRNLTQAQRDLFGSHTYQRLDRPDAGFVHTDWRRRPAYLVFRDALWPAPGTPGAAAPKLSVVVGPGTAVK